MKIMYVVEPMIGIGPNVEALNFARTLNKSDLPIEMVILIDDTIKIEESEKVKWVKLKQWRTLPHNFFHISNGTQVGVDFLTNQRETIIDTFISEKPDIVVFHNLHSGYEWDELVKYSYFEPIQFIRDNFPKTKIVSYLMGIVDGFENYSLEDAIDYYRYVTRWVDEIWLASDNRDLFLDSCKPAYLFKELLRPLGYNFYWERKTDQVSNKKDEIIISAGGGDQSFELYKSIIKTADYCKTVNNEFANSNWVFYVGQIAADKFLSLKSLSKHNPAISIFNNLDVSEFTNKLSQARLSISQCGQSMSCVLEASKVASLLVPRTSGGKELEQYYRAKYLNDKGRASIVSEDGLTEEVILKGMREALDMPEREVGYNLNGTLNALNYALRFVEAKEYLKYDSGLLNTDKQYLKEMAEENIFS